MVFFSSPGVVPEEVCPQDFRASRSIQSLASLLTAAHEAAAGHGPVGQTTSRHRSL